MAKLMNPPQKKKYTKIKKKREPIQIDKYKKRIIIISAILLAAIIISVGLGIFLNWYFVDTKYDSIFFNSYLTLPDYKNMTLSNEEVNKSFEKYKKEFLFSKATFEELKEGVIAEGNNVTIDAMGYFITDGVPEATPYSGSKLDDYEVTDVGNHVTENGSSFFPEIQNALIGISVAEGTETTAQITYKDDYSIEELRGKTLLFKITVVKVTKTIYPEYNDALIASMNRSDCKTVEQYEKLLREEIELDMIWANIVKETIVNKYPQKHIDTFREDFDNLYETSYNSEKQQNSTLTREEFLASYGMATAEQYEQKKQEYAEGYVKEEMILYRIAKNEKIRVSNSEYKAELDRIVASMKSDSLPYPSRKDAEEAYGKDAILRNLYLSKVHDYLSSVTKRV